MGTDRRVWRLVIVAALAAALALPACGDDDGGESVPTAEQLAESLLVVEDLDGDWTEDFVETPGCPSPDDCDEPFEGVITDDMRADLGGLDLCPEAGEEAVAAAAELPEQVLAIRSFTLEVDRPDVDSVNVSESLLADEPAAAADLFEVLTAGVRTCLANPPTPEDPATGRELELPEIGDDRFGFLLRLGDDRDRWDIRSVLVLDGPTIVAIAVNEVLSTENILSDDDVASIVSAAVDKLP